jgi:quercetin dioxygenase-like cupin family protein
VAQSGNLGKHSQKLEGEQTIMKVVDLNELENNDVSATYLRKIAYGESLTVAKVEVQAGEITQTHSHESEEVIYVLSGSWLFHLPEGDVTLRCGQMLFIPSGVDHSSEVLEDTIALDICSKSRPDWHSGVDKSLHSNPTQFLWGV